MITKEIVILRNFSHVPSGVYVKGTHHRIDESLANLFIESNLAALCDHNNVETNKEIENVSDYIETKNTKTRGRRKKADVNGDK